MGIGLLPPGELLEKFGYISPGGGFNVQQLESDLIRHQRSNPEHWGFGHLVLSEPEETKTSIERPNLSGQRTDPWGTPHYSPMTGFEPSADHNIRMLLTVSQDRPRGALAVYAATFCWIGSYLSCSQVIFITVLLNNPRKVLPRSPRSQLKRLH